jgi:hypothetical protein
MTEATQADDMVDAAFAAAAEALLSFLPENHFARPIGLCELSAARERALERVAAWRAGLH